MSHAFPRIAFESQQLEQGGVDVYLSHHVFVAHAYGRVEDDERRIGLVGNNALHGRRLAQLVAVESESLVVAGNDDKCFLILGPRLQEVDKLSEGFVRIAGRLHVVGCLRGDGVGETDFLQMLGQHERRVAGVGDELHEDCFVLLPYLTIADFLAALLEERHVADALVCAEGFGFAEVVIGDDGVQSEAVGNGSLIPGRYLVDGQQIVARVF